MPHLYPITNKTLVTVDELVPQHYSCHKSLSIILKCNSDKPCRLKKAQRLGNKKQLLINFYTLPQHLKEAIEDTDNRKHTFECHLEIDSEANVFYVNNIFEYNNNLTQSHIQRHKEKKQEFLILFQPNTKTTIVDL